MRKLAFVAVLLWFGATAGAGPTYYFHPTSPDRPYPQSPFATIEFPDVVNGNAISATAPWSLPTGNAGTTGIKATVYGFLPLSFSRTLNASFISETRSLTGHQIDSGGIAFYPSQPQDPELDAIVETPDSLSLTIHRNTNATFTGTFSGAWTTDALPIPVAPGPAVPAPASAVLLALGLAGVLAVRQKFNKRKNPPSLV